MSKILRKWITLDWTKNQVLRAQDIPYDSLNSIKDVLDDHELTKADKVVGAIDGNFASLDVTGNLEDSLKVPPYGVVVGDVDVQTLVNKTLTLPKINENVMLSATATELNQLDGVTVGGTASGDIVTIDDVQTLSNKIIDILKIHDTNDSNTLSIVWNEDDTVDRTLNLDFGLGSRNLTLNENFTIGNGYDITINASTSAGRLNFNNADLTITRTGATNRVLTLMVGTDANAALSVEGTSSIINQDLTTDSTPTLNRLILSSDPTLDTHVGNRLFNDTRYEPWRLSTWIATYTYSIDDIVSYSGQLYICIQAGLNQNPTTAHAFWSLYNEAASYTSITDPAINAAVTTAIVDAYSGTVITLTVAGNAQTIQNPTSLIAGKKFTVVNDDDSYDSVGDNSITVNTIVLGPGEAQAFIWDGDAWVIASGIDAKDITLTPTGAIVATNVQSGIAELEAEKVPYSGATGNVNLGVNALTSINLYGGIAANDGITIEGTSHGTKTTSYVILQPTGGLVAIGHTNPDEMLHLVSSSTKKPVLKLENTHTDNVAHVLEFFKNSSSPADNDSLGAVDFYGRTSTAAITRYAYVIGRSEDVTNAVEGGELQLVVMMNGIERNMLSASGYSGSVNEGEIIFNEEGQDVDYRFETVGGNDSLQIEGSTGLVGINTHDFDGTPAVGQLIIKGTTNDGTTNILVGRDSDEANVFTLDTNGNIISTGFITITNAHLIDNTTPAYDLILSSDSDGTILSADRTLTFDVNNANRTIDLFENFTIGNGNAGTLTYSVASKTLTVEDNVTVGLDVNALEGLAGTGLVTRTAANTFIERTITGTASEVDITDGDGVAGNPTIGLPAVVSITTSLAVPTINAFSLGGKLTGGAFEIEGSLFDINGGAIDGCTIATSNITVGAGKTLNVSAGTLTLADNQISGDKVEGGTIASITISQLSGAMDCNNQAMTNVDINSGAIDGTTIGVTSASTLHSTISQIEMVAEEEKTDNYNITTSDLGKSFRMRAGVEKTFNLPSMGASEDGGRLTFLKGDAFKLILDAADTDTIADSSAGATIYEDTALNVGAAITLEYYHSITKWCIIGGSGTWVTT